MKKILVIFFAIISTVCLFCSCEKSETKTEKEGKDTFQYDLVMFGDQKIKLENGDQIQQDFWNDTRNAIYSHNGKDSENTQKIQLMNNLQIGSNIKDVLNQYNIKPGFAIVNREIDTYGDGTTSIVEEDYQNLDFFTDEKVLDANFGFGYELINEQWKPLDSKTLKSIMQDENNCKNDTLIFHYDTVGNQLADEEDVDEQCVASIRAIRIKANK